MIIGRENISIGSPISLSVAEEKRLDCSAPSTEATVVCAKCGKVRVAPGVWAKPLGDVEAESNDICEPCLNEVRPTPSRRVPMSPTPSGSALTESKVRQVILAKRLKLELRARNTLHAGRRSSVVRLLPSR